MKTKIVIAVGGALLLVEGVATRRVPGALKISLKARVNNTANGCC